MINEITDSEERFVRFDGISLEGKRPTARFRIASQKGYSGRSAVLDKDGDLREFYHVKACDLQKRRRKLIRQGIDPIETDRAIDVLTSRGISDAGPVRRHPPARKL